MNVLEIKWIIFVLVSALIVWISRKSLRNIRSHGFYRFFAWEIILGLFLMNADYWFTNPFQFHQILSWLFLIISLVLIISGVMTFQRKGKVDNSRNDQTLVSIEKTTILVTSGIYKWIRHPFYSSLLFLGWGIFLKHMTIPALILAGCITFLLYITAVKEETENLEFFGEDYYSYMKSTKRFIPFLF